MTKVRRTSLLTMLIFNLCIIAAQADNFVQARGSLPETSFAVYIPEGLSAGTKYPWLLALSPNGRSERSLQFMKQACDRYHWILVAPENGGQPKEFLQLDDMMRDVIETAIKDYPVDPDRMFAAGFAGGAMEAHHLSVILQDRVKGVIANCGIIAGNALQDSNYPGSKLAVFLSNTEDYRYQQMRENADFLKHHNWNITWIQSPPGHRWASPESYTKAVGWLDKQMNDAVLSTSSSPDSLHGFSL